MAVLRLALLCLVLCGTAARAANPDDAANGPHPVLEHPSTLIEDSVALRWRIAGKPPTETVRFRRGRRYLLSLSDQRVELNYRHEGAAPNLILTGWSGGAHCCFTLHVFSLAPPLVHQAIAVDDNDEVGFLAEGDAPPRLRLADFAFAYWRASFAESPAPRLILRFDPATRRYRPDFAAMRQDKPDDAALAALAAQSGGARPTPALWGAMLDLIYSGNAPAARHLLDLAWPKGQRGERHFVACFTRQLHGGRLWQRFHLGSSLDADAAFPPVRISTRGCRA